MALTIRWLDVSSAEAGAWNEEAGHGLVIADFTVSGGAKYFNGSGKLSRAAAYGKQEGIGYIEYGLTGWLTAIVKPSLTTISAAVSPDANSTTERYAGLGTTEAALQLHLATFGPAVMAVQAGFRLPGTSSHANPAMVGNTSSDGDIRLQSGISFDFGRWPSFLDVEGGYRLRSDGAPAEVHIDAALGVLVLPRLTILVRSFSVFCAGEGTAWYPPASYSKLGAAAVYDLDARWSVELGAFQTVFGIGALRERGIKTAVWYRF